MINKIKWLILELECKVKKIPQNTFCERAKIWKTENIKKLENNQEVCYMMNKSSRKLERKREKRRKKRSKKSYKNIS